MSLYSLPGGRSTPASRTGTRWTDDDYERLVTMCREGRELADLSAELCRSEQSVLDRARRMLPVGERGLPRDRAVARLQERLRDDPGYDWSAAMRETPPPPPVEHRVYRREGIAGLRTDELLAVADALVGQPLCDERVRDEVLGLVRRRGLVPELEQQVGARLVRRAEVAGDPYLEQPWAAGPPMPSWPSGQEWERPWCDDDCPVVGPDVATDVAPEGDDPFWW